MNFSAKARGNNLLQVSDGNFGTSYAYRCDGNIPIERCLEQDFFETVKTRLGAGDTIQVVEYKDGIVSASCKLIVISRSKDKLILDIRLIDKIGIVRYESKSVGELKEAASPIPDVKYIHGTGQVEQDKVSKIYSVKCEGVVVYETDKKGLAMAIARGDAPIPS